MTNIQQMSHCVRHDSDCDRDLIWVACLKRRSALNKQPKSLNILIHVIPNVACGMRNPLIE